MPSNSTDGFARGCVLGTDPPSSSVYIEIAELIAGPDAPPWLADCLYQWALSVELADHVDKRQPTRAQMRELLRRVAAAAALLRRALGAASIREFLEDDPAGPIQYHGLLDHCLGDLAARSARAFNSTSLVNKAGKTKAGKGRTSASGALPARTYRALLIAEAWKHFRGEYPGPRNRKAAQAAEAYWRATGAEWDERDCDPLTAWRPHFVKAKASDVADSIRAEFHRHLKEHARRWDSRSCSTLSEDGT
jgi:hypothetical protein